MAFIEYSGIFVLLFIFIYFVIFIYGSQKQRNGIPTTYPIVGTLPGFVKNSHRIHDYITDILISSGGTFMSKGPWFAKMNMLITTDPSDVNHILSKNFSNYPKGPEFRKNFDILGDGIFSSDGELWEIHRKVTMSLFKHASFQSLLKTATGNKIENGLLPVLDSISNRGIEVDLQDIFQRLTFDIICLLILDNDPKSLSLEFPCIPCEKALADAEEAILHRYITPPILQNLQKLLQMGNEKKMNDACKAIDQFMYKCLDENQNKKDEKTGLLTALMREFEGQSGTSGDPNKFLRDTLVTLMAAGRDSTSTALSWLFYLLMKNPIIEDKISEEIHSQLGMKAGEKLKHFHVKELGKMIYLHGAIMEALRLFPPVPFNHKTPLQPDILPSGHHVDKNTQILLSFYSMGNMESIWGKDCREFKPERWFSDGGGIKHEPSYKFTVFNAGPRTCLGKDMSLSQLKIVATTIIHHYHIELVEGHLVVPSDSMVLQMKYGLKVRLTKRNEVKI